MAIGILLAIGVWMATVSFVAAGKIRNPAVAAIVSVSAVVVIPLAFTILYTSFIPWSELGPEEFLDKYIRILIGEHGANMPSLLFSLLIGMALGFAARHILLRRRGG